MAKDLTIRLIGRPKITEDSQTGFKTLVRRYVAQGPRASKAGILDASNPLFLPVGSLDEEFTDHHLVNQGIEPAQGSLDKAYLTREYVQLRNTWFAQSNSDSGTFETISREYAVLRAENSVSLGVSLGYANSSWVKHPKNSDNQNEDPWNYLPEVVKDTTPLLSSYGVSGFANHVWHRKSIKVDHTKPGVDIWSVTWMAPIRPTGRPKISKDSQVGFQRVVRQYQVLSSLADSSDASLFLEVGTADTIFTDHYLVDQQLEPSNQANISTLTRQYVEVRDTYSSESVNESGDLKKIIRKYAVLRTQHSKGYDTTSWANHPHNVGDYSNDPWDYLPAVVKATEPGDLDYAPFSNAAATPAGLKPPMVELNDVSVGSATVVSINSSPHAALADALSFSNSNVSWVRGSAQVDTSNPGIDVWSVSWAAPVTDYWTSHEGKQSGASSSAPPSLFDFDHNGVKILRFGKSGGGSSQVVYKTYISFVVGEDPGTELSSWFNGSGSSIGPSVSMDFHIVGIDGNHRIASFRQAMPNTWRVINTTDGIKFPGTDSSDIKVAEGTAKSEIFNYKHVKDQPYPMYQGQPVMATGGRMDWTHYYDNSSTYASKGGSSISPIFSHGNTRIWKIKLVYIS